MRPCVAPAAAVLATLLLAALPACRILPLKAGTQTNDASRSAFDAASFVSGAWDQRVLPYFQTKATALRTVLDGVAADYAQTAAQHGRRLGDANGPVSFVVQASGRVSAINTESRAGTANIEVETAAGMKAVTLQIGPVVRGSAIRDSLPFVSFQDFTNQIEFAQAGRALTDRAMAGIKPALTTLKVDERVHFSGAMTLTKADDPVVITPVLLQPQAAP
jgi:predicted lipoprotein